MSKNHIIDGKEYVPATIAGKHFGYTKDYMLMLAKAEKIDGKKIGHKWFIYLPSVEAFFLKATKERELRRRSLSEERKRSLDTATQVLRAPVTSNIQVVWSAKRVALLETLVIVIVGISLGSFGYVGTTHQPATLVRADTSHNTLERFAIAIHEFFSRGDERQVFDDRIAMISAPQREENYISTMLGTTTHTSILIAPDELFTATTVEYIRDSFSDDVAVVVDAEDPQTGIVIPHFKEGDGEAYRFLMLPVEVNADTQ